MLLTMSCCLIDKQVAILAGTCGTMYLGVAAPLPACWHPFAFQLLFDSEVWYKQSR